MCLSYASRPWARKTGLFVSFPVPPRAPGPYDCSKLPFATLRVPVGATPPPLLHGLLLQQYLSQFPGLVVAAFCMLYRSFPPYSHLSCSIFQKRKTELAHRAPSLKTKNRPGRSDGPRRPIVGGCRPTVGIREPITRATSFARNLPCATYFSISFYIPNSSHAAVIGRKAPSHRPSSSRLAPTPASIR